MNLQKLCAKKEIKYKLYHWCSVKKATSTNWVFSNLVFLGL